MQGQIWNQAGMPGVTRGEQLCPMLVARCPGTESPASFPSCAFPPCLCSSCAGEMVPLSYRISISPSSGSDRTTRCSLYTQLAGKLLVGSGVEWRWAFHSRGPSVAGLPVAHAMPSSSPVPPSPPQVYFRILALGHSKLAKVKRLKETGTWLGCY